MSLHCQKQWGIQLQIRLIGGIIGKKRPAYDTSLVISKYNFPHNILPVIYL